MLFIPTLILTVAAIAPHGETSPEAAQDRAFNIVGFYCADAVCETVPRPIGRSLKFNQDANKTLFKNVVRHDENWNVTLNCAIDHQRLGRCRLAGQPGNSIVGVPIALQLAKRLKLIEVDSKSPRAIVMISYETGGCPSWYCVPTPAPQPLPPPANR